MSKRRSAAVLAVSAVAGLVPRMASRPALAADCLANPTLSQSGDTVTGAVTNTCPTAQNVKITVRFTAAKGSTCKSFSKSAQVTLGSGDNSESVTVPSGCKGTASFTVQDGKQVVSSSPLVVT